VTSGEEVNPPISDQVIGGTDQSVETFCNDWYKLM
jgi:hypothetical protein